MNIDSMPGLRCTNDWADISPGDLRRCEACRFWDRRSDRPDVNFAMRPCTIATLKSELAGHIFDPWTHANWGCDLFEPKEQHEHKPKDPLDQVPEAAS